MHDPAHLPTVREGCVVEGFIPRFVWSEAHRDGSAHSQPDCEQLSSEAVAGSGRKHEDLVADVVPEEVGVVVRSGPEAVRYENAAGYGLAPRAVAVLVDRPRIGSARVVHLSVTIRVVVTAFAEVPAVVGAGLCAICLLP